MSFSATFLFRASVVAPPQKDQVIPYSLKTLTPLSINSQFLSCTLQHLQVIVVLRVRHITLDISKSWSVSSAFWLLAGVSTKHVPAIPITSLKQAESNHTTWTPLQTPPTERQQHNVFARPLLFLASTWPSRRGPSEIPHAPTTSHKMG